MNEETRTYPFSFTGSGAEYFRIWIVNLALSIVTLGIYSAWAKVRRKRYFNNHTLLDGQNFDYLADPIAILKGRAIAVVLFFLYAMLQKAVPLASVVLLGVFFLATPWIVVKSLQFNARNTSHRGLRFNFTGELGEAARIFIGIGLLVPLSLGLALPWLSYRRTGFIAGHHAFGACRSSYQGRAGAFYVVFLMAVVIMLAAMLLGLVVAFGAVGNIFSGGLSLESFYLAVVLVVVMFYAALPIALGYLKARLARLTFDGTRFDDLALVSRHRARSLIGLYASNLVLIFLTLGLFIPWAQVRSARFWLENLSVTGPAAGLDGVVAAAGADVTATGSEMAEVFDVDLGVA